MNLINIRKDNIDLDERFPFKVFDKPISANSDMGKIYHWHECLEISYVVKGKGRYFIEDRVYEMQPGDVIIINNIEPHYLEVYDEEMIQPVIVFKPSLIFSDTSCSLEKQYLSPFFENCSQFKNKININNPQAYQIRTCMEKIYCEYNEKKFGYEMMIKSLLLFVLAQLVRFFANKDMNLENRAVKRQNLECMQKLLEYINNNFDSDISLQKAASMAGFSPQYFSGFFKKITGNTFVRYLNILRVDKAVKLLQETDKKIIHIANECGFNNIANFNRIFKSITGHNPSDYRIKNISSYNFSQPF